MKKLVVLCSVCLIALASFADPNVKVLKAFSETFKTAKNVKWQEHEDYYSVSFSSSGIMSRVRYDMDGNILSSVRYYEPNVLPLGILSRLKKENPSRELFGVTEVTTGQDMVYLVKMFDKKHWVTVRVDPSGNSQVIEKFKKG